jgi:hypothetical protein
LVARVVGALLGRRQRAQLRYGPDPKLRRSLADKAWLRRRIDALPQQRAGLTAKHERLWLKAERQELLAQHQTGLQPATRVWRHATRSRPRGTKTGWA